MGLVTQETNKDVWAYINSIENISKREDAKTLVNMMQEITKCEPKIWGDHFIIGFDKYSYKRKGGKEEFEWFRTGFAPRKTKLTLYLTMDIAQEQDLLDALGKCKHGRGCLYINKLADVDLIVLRKLIEKCYNPSKE
ncbi:DUF1801 domain-containing protein [Flavobacteriaceae bacterium S356]|uniref:DUF1801 domain-containing protein n=1 Tax=Asprobacillus argus TaxID=3076534 RepID=A0ABU3LGV6_9FLAO|nr:DUF1801 domain-containing protein [Flavobacteriaceae bacterium S356]